MVIQNGKGKEYYDVIGYFHETYEELYLNAEKIGAEKDYYYLYEVFEGEYLNGLRNGKGKQYNADYFRLIFEGIFLNGKKWNGKGKEHNNKGEIDLEYINGEQRK